MRISLEEANGIIGLGNIIRNRAKDVLPNYFRTNKDDEGVRYASNDYNAFVFSKDEIMRFFEESNPVDPTGKPIKGASHIMIVVGAQQKDGVTASGQKFQRGDLTVVAAGVYQLTNKQYVCMDMYNPADEHTPKTTVAELSKNSDNDRINLIFNFKQ